MELSFIVLMVSMAFVFLGFGTHYKDRLLITVSMFIFLILAFICMFEGGGII